MRYYLSVEGGGSKLFAILYDENLNVINAVKRGGVNPLFKNKNEVFLEIESLISELIPSNVTEIERLDFAFAGSADLFLSILNDKLNVKQSSHFNEGQIALFANGVKYGVLAQAGTGSDVFFVQPNKELVVGGWGAYIGDDGSGFDIGQRAIRSAVWADENFAEHTVILDMLRENFNTPSLRKVFSEFTKKYSSREEVASVTKIAGEAANLGDKVAVSIFEYAGEIMAKQVLAGINKLGGTWEGPIIASGGAWKATPIFFESFRKTITKSYPNAKIQLAKFEPVVGGIIANRFNEFSNEKEIFNLLETKFKDFSIIYFK